MRGPIRSTKLLKGTVYVEVPIEWEEYGDDNLPPPEKPGNILERMVADGLAREAGCAKNAVTAEASDVVLEDYRS